MDNRTLYIFIGLFFVGIAALFTVNLIPALQMPIGEKYLSYNDVRGSAVEQNHQKWTLNFEQQNDLIDAINRSIPINKDKMGDLNTNLEFDSIVIYQFNTPEIILKPIGYIKDDLVYSVPQWEKSYLKETTSGKFKKIINSAYDAQRTPNH